MTRPLFFISSRPKQLHANTQSLIVISRGCVESDADSDSLFGVAGRAEIDPSISIALCHVPGFSQLVEALSCDPAEVPDGDYCKRYITSCQWEKNTFSRAHKLDVSVRTRV